MDIATLELFMDVMRRRNFTDIARERGLAPSSVSRTITALENELGIRLFQRTTRKLEPTEAGVIYFKRIVPIISELESARQMAVDLSEEPRGTLRVTAPVTFGQMYVVPLLPELEKQYTALSIELMLTDAYVDLIEKRIDIAVRLGALQDSSYISRKLDSMKFSVCASPDYLKHHDKPRAPEDIKMHNCLLFPRSGHNLDWLFKDKDGKITRIPVNGKCLITNSQAIRQCTKSAMGLALLPNWLVNEDIKSGALIRLFDAFDVSATDYDSAVWLLYPSRDYVPLKARVFMDHLITSFRDETVHSGIP